MNSGLTNLDTLKNHLLPATMAGDVRFDKTITDLGLGVASTFSNFCNRNFLRTVGQVDVFQADRCAFILSRYPIETISAVDTKQKDSDDWQSQDLSIIQSTSKSSGIVYLPENSDAGPYWNEVRFTYTGGFFWETLEPEDAAYPSAQPAGSKALPHDLKLAFLLHCREIWSKLDKLGGGLVDAPGAQSVLADITFSPMVRSTLLNYQQMNPI